MSEWRFEPILDSYLAVFGLSGLLLVVLFAPTTFQSVSPQRRRILLAMRFAISALVMLAMLRPTAVTSDRERQTAVLVVLADVSRSMQLPNAMGESKSRWEAQRDLLQRAAPLLRQLDEEMEIRIYGFGENLVPLAWSEGRLELPDGADHPVTDLGGGLEEAIRREIGQRLAGIVLLSDGSQTVYQPKVELHRVARDLTRLDCPLYAVPFGASGAASQFADLAIENLPEQYTVFVKNELTVEAVLRVRGFVNQPIPVELVVVDPDGVSQTIGPVTVTAREDGEQAPVRLTFSPQTAGAHTLTVRSPAQSRERVVDNNSLTAFLTVREGGLKVAYLIGGIFSAPPGEQIRLRRALAESPDIELDHQFLYDAAEDRARWPVDIRPVLEGNYDVVLIENVDSTALGRENIEALAGLTDKGVGLMMIGGFYSFGPGGYRTTAFHDVLPIEMPRFVRQELGLSRPIQKDFHLDGPLTMIPTRPHPITRLSGGEEDNEALWRKLPPLLGANRFQDVKPRANVLASTDGGEPLLVASEYGAGRVLAFAGDSTRRWARDYAPEHKRFWRQIILWLAKRDVEDTKDVWIRMPQRRYDAGVRMEFTAGVRTGGGDPIIDAMVEAWLIGPDAERIPIDLVQDGDKWRGDYRELAKAGRYALHFAAKSSSESLGETVAEFIVNERDIELGNPAADHDQLTRLVLATSESGGRLVPQEQLPGVLQAIIDQPPQMEIAVQRKWQLAASGPGAWSYFLVLVGLLGAEWYLRKRWRLV